MWNYLPGVPALELFSRCSSSGTIFKPFQLWNYLQGVPHVELLLMFGSGSLGTNSGRYRLVSDNIRISNRQITLTGPVG